MATIVPIVSKKSASSRVKTSSAAATNPILPNEPSRENWPSSPKSGISTIVLGQVGTLRPQPVGLTTLPVASVWPPILAIASTMIARTVAPTMPMRMAPFTCRTSMTMIASRPTTKTSIGQPARNPPMPSSTGTGPTRLPHEAGVDQADEGDEQADAHADGGLQLRRGRRGSTALRKPVSTRTVMMMPSMTTRPMASAQVMPGSLAMPKATKALRPRPVASASG